MKKIPHSFCRIFGKRCHPCRNSPLAFIYRFLSAPSTLFCSIYPALLTFRFFFPTRRSPSTPSNRSPACWPFTLAAKSCIRVCYTYTYYVYRNHKFLYLSWKSRRSPDILDSTLGNVSSAILYTEATFLFGGHFSTETVKNEILQNTGCTFPSRVHRVIRKFIPPPPSLTITLPHNRRFWANAKE